MCAKRIEIQFNEEVITALMDNVKKWEVKWSQIERIGYRTTAGGPWRDDYFLVIRTTGNPRKQYDIPLEWKGVQELSNYVLQLADSKCPLDGVLANCTIEASVTVWPSENSGEPI